MPSPSSKRAAELPPPLQSLGALALVCALLFLPGIGGRDFWAPDEPRFAEVAREMLLSGDWIVLRDNNHLYTDKPPLLFWLVALFSLPFGEVTSVSARLPIALCAIGTACLTAALGRLWFGRFSGWAAGLMLATSYRGLLSAQWVQTDGPLVLFTTLSVFGLARALESRRASAGDLALVYGGVAGALLAKGPVGAAVPVLCALGWAAAEGRPAFLIRLRPWLLAAAALPVVVWGVAVAHISPQAYSMLGAVQEHVFNRFMEGMHHQRPFYYFLISFPLEMMPWTLFLAAWAIPLSPPLDRERAGRRRALIWLLLLLAMFTLSTEKRPVYLLPAFPAACLFLAGSWPRNGWLPGTAGERRRLLAPFLLFVLVALAALMAAPLVQRRLGGGGWALALAGAAALAAALTALRIAGTGRTHAAFGLAAGAAAALLLGLSLGAAPALDKVKSARPLSERVLRRAGPGARLGTYRLYRSAYAFYTRHFLVEIDSVPDLERFLAQPDSFCFIDREDYESLPAGLRQRYPPLEKESVGHRRMLVIGRDSP